VNVDPKIAPRRSSNRPAEVIVREPLPLPDEAAFWRMASQGATIGVFLIAFGVFLYFAKPLLVPVLAALTVGMTVGPLVGKARDRGVPSWVMALTVVLGMLAALYVISISVFGPASELVGRMGEIGTAIKDKLYFLERPMAEFQSLQGAILGGSPKPAVTVETNQSKVLESVVTVVTPKAVEILLEVILFFGTLFFFILGRAKFRRYLVNAFTARDVRLRTLKIMNDIEENLSSYLLVVTAINLSLGAVTVLMTYLLGLPTPLLWGALAFGLNYLPYVGPGIMYVILFGIGLLSFPTLWGALLPPGIFMAVTLVEGQFLTPAIVGHRVLNVHPLVIFLGIAFWAWLWGPVGAFLAMPIIIMATVALNHIYPSKTETLPG
jgi:predicted PurR-regulated permease PerM